MTTLLERPQEGTATAESSLVASLPAAQKPTAPLEASMQTILDFLRAEGAIVRVADIVAYTAVNSSVQLAAKEWAEAAYWKLLSQKRIQRDRFEFVSLA